jgi:hypothetical protein
LIGHLRGFAMHLQQAMAGHECSALWQNPLTTRPRLKRPAGYQGLIRRSRRAAESSSAEPTRIRACKAFCLLAAMAIARFALRRIGTALPFLIIQYANNGPIGRDAQDFAQQ